MTDSFENWSDTYQHHIGRNLGTISKAQQERLRRAKVAVLGLGGIGGPCFEVLVRSGVGRFSLVDKDAFEASNLNRQVFAFHSTLGVPKIEVSRRFALDINPEAEIEGYDHIDDENVAEILSGAEVAVFAIDELKPCLLASRKAREMDIPVVESWGLPYGNVRVFTRDTPTLESAYGLPTESREVEEIPDEELARLGLNAIIGLKEIEGILAHYQPDVEERLRQGATPSFAPFVWLSSILLAIETIKVLLDLGTLALGPRFVLYDPFTHEKKHP